MVNIMKLTQLDKKLLTELDADARTPTTLLAKKCRSSPSVIEYRMKRLEKHQFIQNYVTLLDAGKLGLMVWNVYVQLQNTTPKDETAFLNYLCSLKESWWVATCAGNWDIIYSIVINDIKEFHDTVNTILNKYGQFILKQNIVAHANIEIISRGYFTNKAGIAKKWYSTVEKMPLDNTDIAILKMISRNARMPSTTIAQQTGLTARIVNYRLKLR